MQQKQKIWTPIVHFAAHTFVGSIIFLIVGLAAVGLSILVHMLADWGVDIFTVFVLTLLERVILVADAVLFVIYLSVTAIKTVKEFFDEEPTAE